METFSESAPLLSIGAVVALLMSSHPLIILQEQRTNRVQRGNPIAVSVMVLSGTQAVW